MMLESKKKKERLQECLQLLSLLNDIDDNKGRREMRQFLILSMAGTTAGFGDTCDFETNERLRNFEFPGGHSNILKSAESNMRTALQTCDKNEGPRRKEKLTDPDGLVG